MNNGCILFKETKYENALEKFKKAKKIIGNRADISYNIALCYYQLKQYDYALKHIADIIEKGIKENPGKNKNKISIKIKFLSRTKRWYANRRN